MAKHKKIQKKNQTSDQKKKIQPKTGWKWQPSSRHHRPDCWNGAIGLFQYFSRPIAF
jgi:hypothetical protein